MEFNIARTSAPGGVSYNQHSKNTQRNGTELLNQARKLRKDIEHTCHFRYDETTECIKKSKMALDYYFKAVEAGATLDLGYHYGGADRRDINDVLNVIKEADWGSYSTYHSDIELFKKIFDSGFNTEEKYEIDFQSSENRYRIGILYENGLIVPRDKHEAIKYYKKSGHPGAHDRLGNLYQSGDSVRKDYAVAYYHFERSSDKSQATDLAQERPSLEDPFYKQHFSQTYSAALQGDSDALYLLGDMYKNGNQYVDKNHAAAIEYFEAARDAGHSSAAEDLLKFYDELPWYSEYKIKSTLMSAWVQITSLGNDNTSTRGPASYKIANDNL
jgi:hypothetical protein